MQKSKIEWTQYVWNAIRGLCPVNCKTPDGKEYCYARRMYKRFGWNPEVRLESCFKIVPEGSKIFTCSTFELFYPSVSKECRDIIFSRFEINTQYTFQILTKMPENIDREMPDNVWLGVTVTERDELHKIIKLRKQKARIKFVSFEPVLGNLPIWWGGLSGIDWIIIGKLTGFGHKYEPSNHIFKRRLAQIFIEARRHNIPIFLKNNLKEIWGEDNLIQEMPKEEG